MKSFLKSNNGKSLIIIVLFALIVVVFSLILTPSKGKNEGPIYIKYNKKSILPIKKEISIKENKEDTLELVRFDGGFFSINLPKGWRIETVGSYAGFGFRAYDPNHVNRQIFYYGKMEPFLKNKKAGNILEYPYFKEAVVLNPGTAEELFKNWNGIKTYDSKYGSKTHKFAELNELKVLERPKYKTLLSKAAYSEGMIRATFKGFNDEECEGLFASSIFTPGSYMIGGTDVYFYTAYSTVGITAEADKFLHFENKLSEALSTFTFTQEYVNEANRVSNETTQTILNNGKIMSEASDAYNKAWSDRQTSYDVISQKQSDATLGYDRLVDTETGETYRAEVGFYDSYDSNRSAYKNQNLELVTDNSNYLKSVSGYIYK